MNMHAHKSNVTIDTHKTHLKQEASINIWVIAPSDHFYLVHAPLALNLNHAEERKSGWHTVIWWNWVTLAVNAGIMPNLNHNLQRHHITYESNKNPSKRQLDVYDKQAP